MEEILTSKCCLLLLFIVIIIIYTDTLYLYRFESEIIKNLNYFHGLWTAQQTRRAQLDKGDKSWQKDFLASETWRNLRMTCRGFFGYCRYVIQYADAHRAEIKFNAISPAHSNSSVIEAWFSLVRMAKQDSAPCYLAYIKNRQLINAHKALDGNKMYAGADVGVLTHGKDVGIRELSNTQKGREKRKNDLISQYENSRDEDSAISTKKFSLSAKDVLLPDSSKQELEVLESLTRMELPHGYMGRLTSLDTFHEWLRLCFDNGDVGPWFEELFLLNRTKLGAAKFNEGCRAIQDKLLHLAAKCMRKRRDKSTSFEVETHKFFKSKEFDELCGVHLFGNLGESHVGCVMLGLMLAELLLDWLALSLRWARQKSNPELFQKKQDQRLTPAEENNEVNSFVGWSIFSAMKKYVNVDEEESENECKQLLSAMCLREEDADDEYLANYYDTNMSMLNHGGLTLVSRHFFNWGKSTMQYIRDAFTVDDIQQAPKNCFKNGKKRVLQSISIRSQLVLLCKAHPLSFTSAAIDEVYNIILPKMIHARFAVVFRHWKGLHCQKHEVAFRTKMKASVKENDGKEYKKRSAAEQPDESVSDTKMMKIS